jgi:hypothetical protein
MTLQSTLQTLAFSSKHNSKFIGHSTSASSVPFPLLSLFDNAFSSANLYPPEDPLDLSIEQILSAAEGKKQDLQREANRGILRNDMPRALGALSSINAIDDFVYLLKIRSGSQLGLPVARKRRAKLLPKPEKE